MGHDFRVTDSVDYPKGRSEQEWAEQLSDAEFAVLRRGGTERPGSGEYNECATVGVYRCRACATELFRSETKFDSGCGWPAFYAPLAEDRVQYVADSSRGQERVEVRCAACGSHLGHVFEGEGYVTPTDKRYCINSICLTLEPSEMP